MRSKIIKRAALALWLMAAGLMLGGCVNQISEREMVDLSARAIEAGAPVPLEDGVTGREELVTLYFLSEDGTMLSPVARRIEIAGGVSRAQAALETLLQGPVKGERGVIWPDLGTARSGRLLEVSSGVATVDLPAHARTLPQETLLGVRLAIANTLTEFQEISYVNVLIGGREEGLDLGATLPVGTLSRVDDLDAGARYNRLHEQRLSSSGVTLLTTLYFPSSDGRMILPEVRNVAYAQVSPIEYLYTLLVELGKGASLALSTHDVPAPMDYIEKMPEIVRTEDGYLAIELCMNEALEAALEDAQLTLGVYMAMLTDTLMGFVPGVEGVRMSVGETVITELTPQQTPDAAALIFEQTLATRDDFSGFVGAPTTIYAMGDGALTRTQRVLNQARVHDARERLTALMELPREYGQVLPEGLTQEDVLAVHVGDQVIAVNLSGDFLEAMKALSDEQERLAVYAMVNTLTEDTQAMRVAFFFEGKQVEKLSGELDMRGTFLRNPGMVVD